MKMEKYKSDMDKLIAKSKKKSNSLTQEDTHSYNTYLKKLLDESGLTQEILYYVVNAVQICGLDSLAVWLEEQEMPCKHLKKFLGSKHFKEKKADIKAGVLFSLLKSLLSEEAVPPECTETLLTEISAACKCKNGKWLASIHKIFYKRLSNCLSLEAYLPPPAVLGLDQNTQALIGEMAENIYAKMMEDDGSKPDGLKQRRVLEWLGKKYPSNEDMAGLRTDRGDSDTNNERRHPLHTDVSQKNAAVLTARPASSGEADLEADAVQVPPGTTAKGGATAHDQSILTLNERTASMLFEIGEHARALAEKNRKLLEENLILKSDLADSTRTIEALRRSKEALSQDIKEREQEIAAIKAEINRLESEYAQFRNESDERLSRKDEDLERFGQLIREQDRQKEVFRNRLAKALRTDYQEFLEAADSEMTIEMGNIMLAKIEGIFGVLKENGVNPGEHS